MELDLEIDIEKIEQLLDQSANECYNILMTQGIKPLVESNSGVIQTLDNLIGYFESKEEYHKCSEILKIKKQYEG
jgi:hypothetical protein